MVNITLIILGHILSGLLALVLVGRSERDLGIDREGGGLMFLFGYVGLFVALVVFLVGHFAKRNFLKYFIDLGAK